MQIKDVFQTFNSTEVDFFQFFSSPFHILITLTQLRVKILKTKSTVWLLRSPEHKNRK